MSPPFLDTAIIKALQRNPTANQAAIRAEVGCSKVSMKDAVQRLRFAGKIQWASFALAGSLMPAVPTVSEQVKAEAKTKGQRRTNARKLSATVHDPLPTAPAESIADRFRRLAREQEEDEIAAAAELDADERRTRDLDRLGSPSAVLRRAQRDWPRQCADVAAIAKELGIGLGECWRRVIMAGVDCLRDGGDEGAVA